MADKGSDVTFASADGTILAGTLLVPKGNGPFPAVVFVHGSGAEERRNSLIRAKKFVKNGVAALIYDKRGVGESQGEKDFHRYFSFTKLAEDVVAAMEFLSSRQEILPNKIGIVGQSQGGWVAPLAATLYSATSFMIIVSGSVSTVAEDNVFERSARLRKEGFDEESISIVEDMHLIDLEVSRSGNHFDDFSAFWNKYKNAPWFRRVYLGEEPMTSDHAYRQWYRTVMDFDPQPYFRSLHVPTLFLYGDPALDRFCPVTLSSQRVEQLKSNGRDYQIISIKGADHSLHIGKKDMATSDDVFAWLAATIAK